MSKYAIINTDTRTITSLDVPNYEDALKAANLAPGELDFGTFAILKDGSTFTVVVYEFGLIIPKQTTYFRLNKNLYNGNSVIYKANIEGETIDFPDAIIEHWKTCPEFEWFKNIDAVEQAIQAGRVNRPQTSINDQVIWLWNQETSQ